MTKTDMMEGNKLLFVGEEILPFLPESPMSVYGKTTLKYISENGMEVRALLPKFGNINERRNQLHEVIRLSGLNIIVDDTDHPLLIKVASLPGTRIQVYFIDNDDLFKKRPLFKDSEGKEFEDNYERAVFYARSTMETCKLLHWNPSIIQCQGWFSTLVPFFLKNAYQDDPIFTQSKVILTLYNETMESLLPENFANMLSFRDITAKTVKDSGMELKTFEDYLKFSILYSDGIVCGDKDVKPELIAFAREKNIPVLEYSDTDFAARTLDFYKSL